MSGRNTVPNLMLAPKMHFALSEPAMAAWAMKAESRLLQ